MSAQPDNALTIVRLLDAPREKVWRACREIEALRQWWGMPDGATMPFCTLDFRVGGTLHFQVEIPDGRTIWIKCIYREIVEGEKLVMEQYHCDASGKELVSPDWPVSTIALAFESVGAKTKLTVVQSGMASAAHPIEQYQAGWSQSLGRLIAHLG